MEKQPFSFNDILFALTENKKIADIIGAASTVQSGATTAFTDELDRFFTGGGTVNPKPQPKADPNMLALVDSDGKVVANVSKDFVLELLLEKLSKGE